MSTSATIIRVNAQSYEDYDDCLTAASRDIAANQGLEMWQVEASWEDDSTRETILVRVMAPSPREEAAVRHLAEAIELERTPPQEQARIPGELT